MFHPLYPLVTDMSSGSPLEIPPNSTARTSTSNQQEYNLTRPDSPITNVAQTVVSRLGDAERGENPQDSDVLFVEPLTVRQPLSSTTESSQAHTTPSFSQAMGPAQVNTNADKLGDSPLLSATLYQ
ncbi:hypothetical protein LIER_30953 [Lithospermum erythrorhizon]|uniref:Uncharacterized protein n=1 Tax=Lithospermum erythrorhizon TaxID=34254 RepID=A0AAV3RVB1_LITER